MAASSFERRKLRSNNSGRALGFLFEAVADSHDVRDVALADSNGLLLAHWGDEENCSVLAAYGPLLSKTIDRGTREYVLGTLLESIDGATAERVSVRRVNAGDQELFLCILGEPGAAKDVALNRVTSGARRILAN